MIYRLLPFIALLSFALVPFAIGTAEEKAASEPKTTTEQKTAVANEVASEKVAVEKLTPAASVAASECLASEEVIRDLESREKKLKKREEEITEKEKEIAAQLAAVKEEMAKLETRQSEIQNLKAKELSANEEKVNKLIETLESMSPKAAAGVIGGVDEELAVTALTRLSSVKAGKILSNLKNEQSSRLSERMAYGKLNSGKEKARGESAERVPASKQ